MRSLSEADLSHGSKLSGKALRIAIAFITVYLVWGSTYLAIRIAVQSMPPFLLGGVRFLASGAIMLALAFLRENHLKISRTDAIYAALVGLLLFLGGNGLLNVAEQTVASGLAALIIAIIPLWIAGFEAITGSSEKLGARSIFGILLGFVGVVVLVSPDLIGLRLSIAFGEGLLIVATMSWAAGSLIARHHKFQTSLFLLSAVQMLAGGLAMSAISAVQNLFRPEVFAAITGPSWWALAYLIVFGSCVAFTAYVYLLRNVVASRVATYAYVNPVIAVLLGSVILNEPLTAWILAGMVIILVSLSLIRH